MKGVVRRCAGGKKRNSKNWLPMELNLNVALVEIAIISLIIMNPK